MPGPCVIHWFRRDLRIADNPALFQAAKSGLPVVPVYFVSDWRGIHAWTGANRQHFLCECLSSLSGDLAAVGGRLIIRSGGPLEGFRRLLRETGAVAVHFNTSPDPSGRMMERRLRQLCDELAVACHAHQDVSLHSPEQVLTREGLPYRVYTPYSRNWLALDKPRPVGRPAPLATPTGLSSDPLPTVAHWGLGIPAARMLEAGERAARERLKRAVAGTIRNYAARRDLPAADGTTRLSQDLRFGLLSIRTVFAAAMKSRETADAAGRSGIDVFIKELAWREFYLAILHHFPNVLDEEFNPEWRGLPWHEPGSCFELWKQGRTGLPIVDAGIRELLATGFMHNRLRMIVAMFLTKDLHHDWKLGESFFMQHLADGEIASNNGGWQWSAGTGADAAPYFRIQNPWSQTIRHDPEGAYIKRWLPELRHVHPARFMEPPKDGRPIAPGYPVPCVDHHAERARTLAIFQRHRAASGR
jgi:deoxyribodipyrimidine photo-lyase